ncbi:PAS domain-containing protein [Devosia sp. A8/3-2]|nr:PAS domain-containing protein [Devosia sp. A8/3-2]
MQQTSTRTLYDYWNAIRGSRSAPDRKDIDPTRIHEALANTFILEFDEAEKFSFRPAGSHLCTSYCRELKGRSFNALWHERDRDAMDTLIRAVTEDHAVALVTFRGTTALHTKVSFRNHPDATAPQWLHPHPPARRHVSAGGALLARRPAHSRAAHHRPAPDLAGRCGNGRNRAQKSPPMWAMTSAIWALPARTCPCPPRSMAAAPGAMLTGRHRRRPQ